MSDTDNTPNLVIEHLRCMRGKIDLLSEDMQLVKGRSTSLEAQVAGLHNQVALVHGDMATVHGRRLDLADESR